jgi:class 3 adenylate cyclase
MSTHTWSHARAQERIGKAIDQVRKVEVLDYSRDTSLESIPTNRAYRMDAVHLYADIKNLDEILDSTDVEGERCHQRALRFLNQHYRAVHRILGRCDAMRVDFHNQRLHSVVSKPYNSEANAEKKRLQRAVAIGQLIVDVLEETGDDDEQIPNAKVRIGVDSGKALAVNSGRRGGREPLFLGEPANIAAKYSAGGGVGIFLTANAREVLGFEKVEKPKQTALTKAEVNECQNAAALEVTKDEIVEEWREDMKNNPIGAFQFSGHTPPMRTLDIEALTPRNSRRQDLLSVYADIDGFTKYVATNVQGNPEDVVRTLHVLRAELDCVLSSDFEGRRIRFIGDCIHGVMCEGTAQTTDVQESISDATLSAGALRSSFELGLEKLQEEGWETGKLGLAIGFEFGPTAISRLGMQGSKVRSCVSRAVLASEREQTRCKGTETAIGASAYAKATKAVRNIFGDERILADLDYDEAVQRLAEEGDKKARAAKCAYYATTTPAIARQAQQPARPHSSEA